MTALALLLLLAPDAAKIEAFGTRWFRERPKTAFEEWDSSVRGKLLEEARAMGPIPEGGLEAARDALWKAARKSGPRAKGTDRLTFATPYGAAAILVKPGGKGLGIALHGGGEGSGSAADALRDWGYRSILRFAPQGVRLVEDGWNRVHGERLVLTAIEIAKAQFDVDPDRVYLGGSFMGASGTWAIGGRHPDLFAAVAPLMPILPATPSVAVSRKEEVGALQHGLVPNVRNLAIYWTTDVGSSKAPSGTSLFAWDAIQESRKGDPEGYARIEFQALKGLATDLPPGEPGKAIAWMEKQRRDPLPERIVWEYASDPHPQPDPDDKVTRFVKRDFYWLHQERPQDQSRVEARRKGNEFDLTLVGAETRGLTIWLNPRMIDVAKDVIVRVDGKELYRGKPAPDFVTILETLDARLDRSLTFDRRITLPP